MLAEVVCREEVNQVEMLCILYNIILGVCMGEKVPPKVQQEVDVVFFVLHVQNNKITLCL